MITAGCFSKVFGGACAAEGYTPIVLVQSTKSMGGKMKLIISDTTRACTAMCTQGSGALVEAGECSEGSLVQLKNYSTSSVSGQDIIIILEMLVVGRSTGDMNASAAPAAAPMVPTTANNNNYQTPASSAYTPSNYNPSPSKSANPNPNSRPVANNGMGGGENCIPISALNPYTNRWTIKARVTFKSDIRKWSNAKGEGTLFNIELLDGENESIRATFFKEAADKFYPMIESGSVYYFSMGKVKPVTNHQYDKANYSLTFDTRSEIKECFDTNDIKSVSYEFTNILDISSKEPGAMIDVLGVVKSASDVAEIISQKQGGKQLQKRDLLLIDSTGADIKLTLWGEKALYEPNPPYHAHPIIAIKTVRVGDYGGRSLSAMNTSSIVMNPDLPEAYELHKWREQFGDQLPTGTSLSSGGAIERIAGQEPMDRRKSISDIKDNNLGYAEKPDYITLKCSVSFIKHDNDPWYCACPSEGCNKKVIETSDNKWRCEKCNMEHAECNRRFILSANMSDSTGQAWFSLFNDTAETLLGTSAEACYQLKSAVFDESAGAAYEEVFNNALFKDYICRVKVKSETHNDEQRVKNTIMALTPVDYVYECKELLEAINKY